MGSPSRSKSHTETQKPPVDILRVHIAKLGDTLNELVEVINKVNSEVKSLQPLLDTANKVWAETEQEISNESLTPITGIEDQELVEATTTDVSTTVFLEEINTLSVPELIDKLKMANAKQNVIRNIINERKKMHFHSFESLDDLIVRTKGLARASLEKIMSEWS